MSAQLTTIIQTQNNSAGMDAAQQDQKALQKQMAQTQAAAVSTSTNYDSMMRVMTRPMKGLVFGAVAQDLMGMTGGMEKASAATQAIQRTLLSAGNAFMWFNPIVGGVALAIAGLVVLYTKLHTAQTTTTEDMKKEAEALTHESGMLTLVIAKWKENGSITKEQAKIMQDRLAVVNSTIEADKRQAESAQANITLYKARISELTASMNKEKEDIQSLTTANRNLTAAEHEELEAKSKSITESQTKIEYLNKEIDRLQKLIDAYGGYLQAEKKEKQSAQDLNSVFKAQAAEFLQYTSIVGSSFEKQNGIIMMSMDKFGAAFVQKSTTMAATYVAALGMANMAIPGMQGVGIAELAAAAAIQTMGAAAGLLFGGGESSVSPVSTSQGGVSSSPNNNTSNQNPISLTVEIHGGKVTTGLFAEILKGCNAFVTQNNGVSYATTIVNK